MASLYNTQFHGRDDEGFDHALISTNQEALDLKDRLLGAFQNIHTYFYGNEVNQEVVASTIYPELSESVDLTYGPAYLDEIMSERLRIMGLVSEQLNRTQGKTDLMPTFEEIPTTEGMIEIYRSSIPNRLNADAFRRLEWTSLDRDVQVEITREADTVAKQLNAYFGSFRNGDFRVLYTAPDTTLFNDFIFKRMLVDCSYTSEDVLALVIKRKAHFEQSVKSAKARIELEERIRSLKNRASKRISRFTFFR